MTPSCSPVKFVSSVVFTIKVSGYLHSACLSARSTCCCWETHVIVYTIRCKEGPTCSVCIIGPLGDSRNGMDWYLECSLAAFFSFACFSRMILRKLLRNERIKIQLSTTLIVVFERKEVDCLMSRAYSLSSGSKRSWGISPMPRSEFRNIQISDSPAIRCTVRMGCNVDHYINSDYPKRFTNNMIFVFN